MSTNSPLAAPAAWVSDHIDAIRHASALGPVVDLASGRGRNALFVAKAGAAVIALDRNRDHLRELAVHAARDHCAVQPVRCDLETRRGIPLATDSCGAILVFRFLFRPLAAAIEQTLKPGGILLYETFTMAHRETGRGPRRAEFYLEHNELPGLFPNLEVVAYEEGPDGDVPPTLTARLLARKPV